MLLSKLRYNITRRGLCTLVVICTGGLSSCDHTEIRHQPYKNKLGIKPADLAQVDTVNYTTIKWVKPVQDFGIVNEGDSVLITYRFKNTGANPLFLTKVLPSCGCTEPRYSQSAIMPGENETLSVKLNTTGQLGSIHKTITVITNTANGVQHLLSFHGQVNPKHKR